MAVRLPNLPVHSDRDPFSDVEEKITLKFNQLIEAVMGRRDQLLTELKVLRRKHRDEDFEILPQITELETSKNELTQTCGEVRTNGAKIEMEKSIQNLEEQIDNLKQKMSSSTVGIDLSCDTQKLEQTINYLGKIEEIKQRDYSLIKSPLFKASEFGSLQKQLNNPIGLYIDNPTDLVYIADRGNRRIQVWSLDGNYRRTFGESVLENPHKITITNRALFVTDYDQNSVFKFQLSNFQTLASYNELVFPSAICSSTDRVFVVSDRNAIIVLNTDLQFMESFTEYIERCYDIKVNNSIIYALEVNTNKIKLLDADTGCLVRIVNTDRDGTKFENACHFCLDLNGNFLITNWTTNQIKIISGDGTLLRLIGTSKWKLEKPRGIEVSKASKIALVFATGIFCQI